MSAQPTDRAASFVFVPEWYEALRNSSGSCPWCGAMQHWGHDDACGRAIVMAALADRDRLLAVEKLAREIVALLLTSGQEPPPLNDSGLMSTLAFYAGPNARTAVDSREAARVTALGAAARALRAALARPAEEERG